MEKKRCIRADFSGRRRVICVSDIHGDLELFLRLMEKLNLTDDDALVIIGDFSNKGVNCCELTEFIFELDKRDNVYVLAGNGEFFNIQTYTNDRTWLLRYIKKWPGNLFEPWAKRLGFPELTEDNIVAACAAIDSSYSHIIEWLRDLPWYLETDDSIFVHAGMRELPADGEEPPRTLLKDDEFLTCGENNTGKTVVVGHWPVYNCYDGDRSSNGVLVDEGRRIIGIDGGVGVKSTCRLNALIFENGEMHFDFVHHFHEFEAACDIIGENVVAPMQDNWPDYKFDILQAGGEFSICKMKGSGRIGLVKNEHIGKNDEGNFYRTSSNSYFMDVEKGERLALLDGNCGGYAYVMNVNGVLGFIPRRAVGNSIE